MTDHDGADVTELGELGERTSAELRALLDGLTAPATRRELAGEAEAVAAMASAVAETRAARVRPSARFAAAAAVALIAVGGAAFVGAGGYGPSMPPAVEIDQAVSADATTRPRSPRRSRTTPATPRSRTSSGRSTRPRPAKRRSRV